jgi:hypothetical protein
LLVKIGDALRAPLRFGLGKLLFTLILSLLLQHHGPCATGASLLQILVQSFQLIVHSHEPLEVGDCVLAAPADRIAQVLLEISHVGFRIKDAFSQAFIDAL